MKKIIFILLLFSFFGFSQKEYKFDHYTIYACNKSIENKSSTLISYENSNDDSYFLHLYVNLNNEVETIKMILKKKGKIIIFDGTPFPLEKFNPNIHLTQSTTYNLNKINSDCSTIYEKKITKNQEENTVTTNYFIYKNRKMKKVKYFIEVKSQNSTEIIKDNFYFAHGEYFFKCNNINFLPNKITSYKMFSSDNILLESLEFIETKNIDFSITINY